MRDEGCEDLPPDGFAVSAGELAEAEDCQGQDAANRTSLPALVRSAFRILASLQLAVVLIAVYAFVVAGATVIESRHGAEVARFMVYGTGWFTALHVLLAVNVLCAMLVRFPWRWRQTGFLLTHGGILVLLLGCAATRWKGVEGQLSVYEGHAEHIAYEESLHSERRCRRWKRRQPAGGAARLHSFRAGTAPLERRQSVGSVCLASGTSNSRHDLRRRRHRVGDARLRD
jgi:hypothetical protein